MRHLPSLIPGKVSSRHIAFLPSRLVLPSDCLPLVKVVASCLAPSAVRASASSESAVPMTVAAADWVPLSLS